MQDPQQSSTSLGPEKNRTKHSPVAKAIGIVVICFVGSFLGAWALIQSGLVRVSSDRVLVESQRQLVLQEGEVVAQTAKEVSPSVVSIVVRTNGLGRSIISEESGGSGTGIIISSSGYIITNKHVIPETTQNVKVVLSDGTAYEDVRVIGRDPLNDLAFLKIDGVTNLTAAKITDKAVITGQKVIAIGNALGQYQNTVTSGIISGMGRPVTASDQGTGATEQLQDLYQTDAAINPGNSGGPLVNLSGEVIGINTAVVNDAQGIGFAIPIRAAKGLIKGVLNSGKLERAYIGTRFVTLTPEVARRLKLSVKHGAYIKTDADENAIIRGGPADKAGLKEGDIITKVNNEVIDENGGLGLLVAQYSAGEKITLTLLRGNKEITLQATLEPYQARRL